MFGFGKNETEFFGVFIENGEKIKELKKRLEEIEKRESIIGEFYGIYCKDIRFWSFERNWQKFTAKDVTDEVENNVKIFGIWIKKEDIIYYDSKYDKQKKLIEKRHENIDKKR